MGSAGRFITFEGPEGCGKSTQARLLVDRLASEGVEVIYTREPGGTATGEAIRNILQHDAVDELLDPRGELLLFSASRAQLVHTLILPALEEGKWVICDRFIDSTMAYQGYGRGMDLKELAQINTFAISGRKPDMTFLLDLPVADAFDRLEKRFAERNETADRFEREERAFHHRIRDGYLALAAQEPQRFHVMNAARSVDEIRTDIWTALAKGM